MPSFTLADMLAENTRLFVNCADPRCGHSAEADVLAFADKLGPATARCTTTWSGCSPAAVAGRPAGTTGKSSSRLCRTTTEWTAAAAACQEVKGPAGDALV